MQTATTTPELGLLDPTIQRLHLLGIVQTCIAIVATIEVAVFTGFGAAGPMPLALTLAGAAATGWLVRRLRRPDRQILVWLRRLQIGWIVLALIDLALSLFMVRKGLPLAAMVTRFVLPIWIRRLTRKALDDVA